MNELPEPLVPADVDLRDFAFMPLDVRRLRDSRLVSTKKPEEALAAILLWSASWHQQPASSLPDDDVELSQLAGYGRAAREFRRIREGALYGFIKCSDGRFYHPVVAEKAAEAWNRKLEAEWRRAADRVRKENKDRKEKSEQEQPIPAKPTLLSVDIFFGIPRWSYGNYANSGGIPPDGARNSRLKRQGQGQGEGQGQGPDSPDSPLRSESSPRSAAVTALPGKSAVAWNAYAAAYQQRYGTEPLRNAQTNAQMARFVSLVGKDAPDIAAFYVSVNERWLIQHRHPVGALVKGADSYWTQWKTGQKSTESGARQADQSAERGEQAQRFLAKVKP